MRKQRDGYFPPFGMIPRAPKFLFGCRLLYGVSEFFWFSLCADTRRAVNEIASFGSFVGSDGLTGFANCFIVVWFVSLLFGFR